MNEEKKPIDTSDKEDISNRKKRHQQRQRQNDKDLRVVMDTREGRNVIGRILSLKSPYSMSYSNDPYITAFNEGMRRITCILVDELMRVCPEIYLTMVRENLKTENGDENE